MKSPLKTSARYLKGIGPEKFKILNRLGIKTIEDLLYLFPRRYEDRRSFVPISQLIESEKKALVKGEVLTKGVIRLKTGHTLFKIAVSDKTGILYALWFNQPYLAGTFSIKSKVVLYGRVERSGTCQMTHPEYEIVKSFDDPSVHFSRIVPIYPLTEHLTQKQLRFIQWQLLKEMSKEIDDFVPSTILSRLDFSDLLFAFQNIHFPSDADGYTKAYRRLVFNEFLLMQLTVALRRKKFANALVQVRHTQGGELFERFTASLPYPLTLTQKKAVEEIKKDMTQGKPMNRLLEGDVGSGKTIVAAHALVFSVSNKAQGALMAPTEILAKQHRMTLGELLEPLGVRIELLVQGLTPADKEGALRRIEQGEADVVIGTHAMIQKNVRFATLGVVVIDEQHKFGVFQRAALKQKGKEPHLLVMTATPIPRTLAMTLYGDLDLSVIAEAPAGRGNVHTLCLSEEEREAVVRLVREEIQKGRQAFFVYPVIEDSSHFNAKSAVSMFEHLKTKIFPDLKLGLIHGRLSSREKNSVMKDFKEQKLDILVSTTVIEVGLDVPNATFMVIENAERFGLSQLHQLRGRIGRGEHDATCVVLTSSQDEETLARLSAFAELQSGFELAEKDLVLRGPGDFFGKRQHGLPELVIGDIVKDAHLLQLARDEAQKMVEEDSSLSNSEHRSLSLKLSERFRQYDLGSLSDAS